jgi:hypothetical protein
MPPRKLRKNASPKGRFVDPSRPNRIIEVSPATFNIGSREFDRNRGNKKGIFDVITFKQEGQFRARFEKAQVLTRKQVFDLINSGKLRKPVRFSGDASLTRG